MRFFWALSQVFLIAGFELLKPWPFFVASVADDRALLAQIRSGNIAFDNQRLFSPFTTTLVEIRLDRDAYPLDLTQISNVFGWDRLDTQ